MPSPETSSEPTPDVAPSGARRAATADPSLRRHLGDAWSSAPAIVRWGALAVVVAGVAWAAIGALADAGPPDEEVRQEEAAAARAEWAAMRRMDPAPLGGDPVADVLGPGDAERSDDRYADYYVHEADSVAFSVLATSDDFAPDLTVRRPDGRTVGASDLLRTATRAEIGGLMGPGRFEIVVTSRQPGARGAYELAVLPAGPIDSVYVDDRGRADTLGRGPLRAGRYERLYGVATGSETPVVVSVVGEGFRPRLHLLGPNGEVRGGWRTVERSSSGDSLFGARLRYLPGWDAPYRLIVTSEEPGATGPFALDVRGIEIRDLRADGRGLRRTLGDESWIADGRYVDTYRFQTRDGDKTVVRVESAAFPPSARLWRVDRRRRAEVAEAANAAGASAVRLEETLDGGEYFLEVSSGGEADSLQGGSYSVVVEAERIERVVVPDSLGGRADGGPVPPSSLYATEVRRTGRSGGSTFEVGVTNVAVSYPGGSRTRVQLSVTVRSVDYRGNWAPWESFAAKSYLVDDDGRRYRVSVAESASPSGTAAEPGTARRGIVAFYAPEVVRGLDRVVFVASVGDETVTLPIRLR